MFTVDVKQQHNNKPTTNICYYQLKVNHLGKKWLFKAFEILRYKRYLSDVAKINKNIITFVSLLKGKLNELILTNIT